jgi:hypothetical protein
MALVRERTIPTETQVAKIFLNKNKNS